MTAEERKKKACTATLAWMSIPENKDHTLKRRSTPEYKLSQKRRDLKSRYKITLEEFNKKLEGQNNKCAICEKEFGSGKINGPHVDHNHINFSVRGLLCFSCNTLLGKSQENIVILKNAIKYLRRYASL